MADIQKLVEELSKLTVMEAVELSKALEETWGRCSSSRPSRSRRRRKIGIRCCFVRCWCKQIGGYQSRKRNDRFGTDRSQSIGRICTKGCERRRCQR